MMKILNLTISRCVECPYYVRDDAVDECRKVVRQIEDDVFSAVAKFCPLENKKEV